MLFTDGLRRILPAWPRFGPPKGLFHAYDELKSGRLPGRVLLESQMIPPPAPGSLRLLAKLGQEGYQPWPIFWTKHSPARLIGNHALLVDDGKRACAEGLYRTHPEGMEDYNTLWLPRPIVLAGNWTSTLTRWEGNYYHWFMDCLPRLALLDQLPPDTRVLVPASLSPFHRQTLQWLGLQQRVQPVPGRHLVVENYFFSTPTVMTGCADPYGVRFLRGKFLPHADPAFTPVEKIYIRRRGKTRDVVNEAEVIAFLEQRGWQAVDLEALTLAQQIQLFAHARGVCGLHGAGFTNLLWCRPGCVAVELLAENFLNGCYDALASCVGVEHRFLIQPGDEAQRIRVDVGRLSQLLPD